MNQTKDLSLVNYCPEQICETYEKTAIAKIPKNHEVRTCQSFST